MSAPEAPVGGIECGPCSSEAHDGDGFATAQPTTPTLGHEPERPRSAFKARRRDGTRPRFATFSHGVVARNSMRLRFGICRRPSASEVISAERSPAYRWRTTRPRRATATAPLYSLSSPATFLYPLALDATNVAPQDRQKQSPWANARALVGPARKIPVDGPFFRRCRALVHDCATANPPYAAGMTLTSQPEKFRRRPVELAVPLYSATHAEVLEKCGGVVSHEPLLVVGRERVETRRCALRSRYQTAAVDPRAL